MIIVKIIVVILFIGMIYINYLANSKPLGGISTGEISNKYNTLFTPSGFTFSIWGIIYLLVGAFVIVNTFQTTYFSPEISIVIYLFIVSMILNASWLFAWHFDKILLSTLIMITFLIVLLLALNSIQDGDTLGYITFSVYAGWISVALIANVSILIKKYNIPLFMEHQQFWFVLILIVSLAIMLTMFLVTSNFIYGLVFLWAYYGIAMKFYQKKKQS